MRSTTQYRGSVVPSSRVQIYAVAGGLAPASGLSSRHHRTTPALLAHPRVGLHTTLAMFQRATTAGLRAAIAPCCTASRAERRGITKPSVMAAIVGASVVAAAAGRRRYPRPFAPGLTKTLPRYGTGSMLNSSAGPACEKLKWPRPGVSEWNYII